MKKDVATKRPFDVICAGLAVGNIVVHPVPEVFLHGDTIQVQEISTMGGGDAFNQACALSALGNTTALLSRMADDDTGYMMRSLLKKRGVDDRYVSVDPIQGTSTCIVLIKENGQRNFLVQKGCLHHFGENNIDFSCVKKAKVVSIGGLFALPAFDKTASIRLLREAKQAGSLTVVDTKYDTYHIGLAGIGDLLSYTDYFFPSYDEAKTLSSMDTPASMASFFRSRGAQHVGIKLGSEGCYLSSDDFVGMLPPFQTPVLDTTGAGDNFMAGLIHGILRGWSFRDASVFANATGALACSRLGATSDLEYLQPIKEILKQNDIGMHLIKEVLH